MALYYGDRLIADDGDYFGGNNQWNGTNVFATLSAADPLLLDKDQLKDSLFFGLYDGQLRHFDFDTLKDALGRNGGGDDQTYMGDPIGVGMNQVSVAQALSAFGNFGVSSEVDGAVTWSNDWSDVLFPQSIMFSSGSGNTGDFCVTQQNVNKSDVTSNSYNHYNVGNPLCPGKFIYSRISAMWQVTSDVPVYVKVDDNMDSNVRSWTFIGKINSIDKEIPEGFRYYKFAGVDPDKASFPKKVWEIQRNEKHGQYFSGGSEASRRYRWYAHSGNSTTKAKILFGTGQQVRAWRPNVTNGFVTMEDFIDYTGQNRMQIPRLVKGDVLYLRYDVEIMSSVPVASSGGSDPVTYYKTSKKGWFPQEPVYKQLLSGYVKNACDIAHSGLSTYFTSAGTCGLGPFNMSAWKART